MQKQIPIMKVSLGEEEVAAVNNVLTSGYLVKGNYAEKVEMLMAKKCGRRFAAMLTSGTVSLNTATTILGLGPGDEVITSAFTFVASATAIIYVGARMVLADIDPDTFNIDPIDIENKITSKTKAIIAVDLFGNPYDYTALKKIAKKYKIMLIEDAAQAHGAVFKNKPAGSLGDVSIFSFYGSKIITSGEGGMILTDREELFEKAISYRAHGESKNSKYYFTDLGYNFMPTDIQAAVLFPQIKRLDKIVRARNKIASNYTKALQGLEGVTTPTVRSGMVHAFSCYTIRLDYRKWNRDVVLNKLNSLGVGARVYYPVPLHLQPVWRKFGYGFKKNEYPEAERASKEVLSLPIYPSMTESEQEYVVTNLVKILKSNDKK